MRRAILILLALLVAKAGDCLFFPDTGVVLADFGASAIIALIGLVMAAATTSYSMVAQGQAQNASAQYQARVAAYKAQVAAQEARWAQYNAQCRAAFGGRA